MQVAHDDQIPLLIITADEDTLTVRLDVARGDSRQNTQAVFWVFAQTEDIDAQVANFYASREMVRQYDQLGAQGRISNEQAASLSDEKIARRATGITYEAN